MSYTLGYRMAHFFLIWLFLIMPCIADATEKVNEIQGCYVEKTYASYVDESEEKWRTVYNFLKISKTSDRKWKFSAVLNGDKSQICYVFGTVKIEKKGGSNIVTVTPDEEAFKESEDLRKCSLQILASPTSLKFQESKGSDCESLFLCGDHARIDGQAFFRKNKVHLNDSRCTP